MSEQGLGLDSDIDKDTAAMLRHVIPLSPEVTVGTFEGRVAVTCMSVGLKTQEKWHWLLTAYLDLRSRGVVLDILNDTHEYSHMERVTDDAEGSIYYRVEKDG